MALMLPGMALIIAASAALVLVFCNRRPAAGAAAPTGTSSTSAGAGRSVRLHNRSSWIRVVPEGWAEVLRAPLQSSRRQS